MAKNNRFAWTRSRSLPVPDGITSGEPVKIGSLVAVALTDRAANGDRAGGNKDGFATVALDGAFDLTVVGALAGTGTPVFIVAADNTLTATVGSNTLFGYSVPGVTADGSKGSGSGLVTVELAQV